MVHFMFCIYIFIGWKIQCCSSVPQYWLWFGFTWNCKYFRSRFTCSMTVQRHGPLQRHNITKSCLVVVPNENTDTKAQSPSWYSKIMAQKLYDFFYSYVNSALYRLVDLPTIE